MYNAAYLLISLIKLKMCWCVRGGFVSSLNFVAIKIHYHHIIRRHGLVINSAWFDNKIPCLPVYLAYISPGIGHEISFRQLHISLINSFL